MSQTPDNQIEKEIVLGGIVYILKGTVDISIVPKEGGIPIPDPDNKPPVPDPTPDKPKDFGTIKQGGKWTLNPGKAETWKLVSMEKPADKFKFISATDSLNIIADLDSKEQAEAIQNYFKTNVFPPKEDGGVIDPNEPDTPPVDPDQTPGEGPYKSKGKIYQSTQRGPTTRHYRSGAPDDNTIEKNVVKIQSGNYMALVDITIPDSKGWEHDDTISIKIGGNHMVNGWFDNGLSIYEGQSCLGTEVKHPSTKKCIVKGKAYGDLRGKRIQVASTYFLSENKTEYWVNIPGVTQGWDKAVEGKDIGGFNSKTKEGEFAFQIRIDGFKDKNKPPLIHSAVGIEI